MDTPRGRGTGPAGRATASHPGRGVVTRHGHAAPHGRAHRDLLNATPLPGQQSGEQEEKGHNHPPQSQRSPI